MSSGRNLVARRLIHCAVAALATASSGGAAVMGILREFGRVVAMVIGLIGSAIALIIVLAWEAFHLTSVLIGSTTDSSTRTGWGLLLVGIAALASVLALFLDRISSILFIIAGVGLFWVISGWAIIPLIFFLIAAFFAFLDRSPARG